MTQLRLRRLALGAGLIELKRGVHEQGGNNRGKEIAAYLANAGVNVAAPWCAAFQQFITDKAAKLHGLSNPLDAVKLQALVQSYAEWARTNKKVVNDPTNAMPGDLILFNFHGTHFDHIGMVASHLLPLGFFKTLEGNTNDAGARDSATGDGVMFKMRRYKPEANMIICWDGGQIFNGTLNKEIEDALKYYGFSA